MEEAMRSERESKLCFDQVQGLTQRILEGVCLSVNPSFLCSVATVLHVVVVAAGRMLSIFAACLQLNSLSDQTVRDHLRAALPKRLHVLQARLNRALLEPLPARTRRRARDLALDLHEIPFHGKPRRKNHVVGRKPKAGTTKFFAYATACLVERGHRYTLAVVWVRQGDSMAEIVDQLLTAVAESGVRVRKALLDRGFFSTSVMRLLQEKNMPFLMPVAFRGRKPKAGRKHTGLRAYLQKPAGWYRFVHGKGRSTVTTRVWVVYKSYRHHRSGKRHNKKLVYASWRVGGTGVAIRENYRKRFGIEASYRQLGQARIRTSTTDPLLRLFFVGVALLLRNVWVYVLWSLFDEQNDAATQQRAKRVQFKRLLSALVAHAEFHLPKKTSIFDEAHSC
jgi:hypothetical protein